MFIVWGTKRVERKQGFVADFCPVCRTIRPFQLTRVNMVGHVYYISFGQGDLDGYFIECADCGLQLNVDPAQYAGTEQRRVTDTEALVNRTFPKLRAVHAERLQLEEQLRKSPTTLSPEQRAELLMEPFGLLNPIVEAHCGEDTHFDKQSGLGCAGTLVLATALFLRATTGTGPTQEVLLWIAGIVFVIGSIYTFSCI
jgi:hypothetical protein